MDVSDGPMDPTSGSCSGDLDTLKRWLRMQDAWGEIKGVMLAAGRYNRKPAVQIMTEEYDAVWCQLSATDIKTFGDEASVSDVWMGKTVGAEGRWTFPRGKLVIMDATIREKANVPPIDLESVLDPDFTAGVDPVEYINRLREGEFA